ncbi:MAG: RagB/SusD family nutrient uptake outer membrane protein [Flavobacterium lindanitolerans]|jgi:starch-binding outer membrane protein, SusD/RagB family|uniref:RagB/SusD family nutrient uptake outer membrane protein n=1 Tax=Flavobacterium microcysteis TaxID=2596891 RepID=A0A501PZL3_9FLAO|nr:RagB/SusD family nutrient uptake outer membrane protein [Flavobacterium lindanitolerans]MBL7869831.1 RagB/SusD family nutrient uptake outer membrane protein [Flavobacterium lindanitolerans]TPD66009.1 RagB/SusD family nutrient uptake outer membrane protein [Flavobacterium microcysteis]
MKLLQKIAIVYVLFTVASCDELIEANLPNNQIGAVQVFEDPQTAYAALSALYANLRQQSLIAGNNYGMGALLGSYSDELNSYYTDLNGYKDVSGNQIQRTNSVVASVWTNAYQQIYSANAIILGAEKSSALIVVDKQQIIGEALLIRSMLYFYLQSIFDEIPYTTVLDYNYNRSLGKVSKEQMLAYLETDLTNAANLLSDNYRDPERIYPNGKVAQILLIHIYLLQGKYTEAQQMASSIIQSPMYQFQPDISEVFHNSGTHILWQLKPQYSGDSTQEASFYYFNDAPPSAYALSEDLISAFAPEDLRKSQWIEGVNAQGNNWYRSSKYKNLSGTNTNEYSIIFRLEEVYLLLAEALVMQDKLPEALPYLNATRLRAGLLQIQPVTKDAFMDEILLEKRREFFAEQGIRFTDLKRTGKLGLLTNVKPNWTPYKSVWPYPQNELLLNPNLAPQHEGY